MENYKIIRKLCDATVGSVYYGERSSDQERVAIKMLPRCELTEDMTQQILREVYILRRIDHPHVIRLEDFIRDEQYFYLIFEYAPGGDLFEFLQSRKRKIKEKYLKKIVKQIVLALEYCYRTHNVIHRDIKLENIFLVKEGCKIGDFGFATWEGNRPNRICGTKEYLSPEMVRGEVVTHKTDIWSLGVMLYECICGNSPFYGYNLREMRERIMVGLINWSRLHKQRCSSDLVNLIYQMLKLNPEDRISYHGILNHQWFGNTNHLLISRMNKNQRRNSV